LINWIQKRRINSYKAVFNGFHGKNVIADLKRFCRWDQPTADINNVYATYVAEGRREMLLRVLSHLNYSESDITKFKEYYGEE